MKEAQDIKKAEVLKGNVNIYLTHIAPADVTIHEDLVGLISAAALLNTKPKMLADSIPGYLKKNVRMRTANDQKFARVYYYWKDNRWQNPYAVFDYTFSKQTIKLSIMTTNEIAKAQKAERKPKPLVYVFKRRAM